MVNTRSRLSARRSRATARCPPRLPPHRRDPPVRALATARAPCARRRPPPRRPPPRVAPVHRSPAGGTAPSRSDPALRSAHSRAGGSREPPASRPHRDPARAPCATATRSRGARSPQWPGGARPRAHRSARRATPPHRDAVAVARGRCAASAHPTPAESHRLSPPPVRAAGIRACLSVEPPPRRTYHRRRRPWLSSLLVRS